MTPDFLLISDPFVKRISVIESHEPLVNLADLSIFLSARRVSSNDLFSFVRKNVADRLLRANALLPRGMSLLFEEGYRPIALQRKLFDDYYRKLAAANPEWTNERVRLDATKYVAPPDGVPPHSTGGAFDVSLADERGNELAMGSCSDDTPDENNDMNFTDCTEISEEARSNRMRLAEALSEAGFVNYPAEWWHWSYGDQYWACSAGAQFAIYGSVIL